MFGKISGYKTTSKYVKICYKSFVYKLKTKGSDSEHLTFYLTLS